MKQKKFYETKDFKKIEAEWYAKLKNEGFKDIEMESEKKFDYIKPQLFSDENSSYFDQCAYWLHNNMVNADELDKTIFGLHAEGLSQREIQHQMRLRDVKLNQSTISRRISKILKQAGITPIEYR